MSQQMPLGDTGKTSPSPSPPLRQRLSSLQQKFTTKLKKVLVYLLLPAKLVLSYILWGSEAAPVADEPIVAAGGGGLEADTMELRAAVDDGLAGQNVDMRSEKEVGRRKALLVGVERIRDPNEKGKKKQKRNMFRTLRGPHHDVDVMGKLLAEKYGYNPEDIITLVDDDDDAHPQPTLEDIKLQIETLVKDARSGDRFFFHFSGHADQEDTDDPEEEDGKNEYMLTCDGFKILDDILKNILVDPLPAGSRLTAIMDCCHSCTLLDLPHYRCNRVYVPWLSKGIRRTKSKWEGQVRKDGIIPDSIPSIASRQNSDTALSLVKAALRNSMAQPLQASSIGSTSTTLHDTKTLPALALNIAEAISGQILDSAQVASPIAGEICSGFCRKRPPEEISPTETASKAKVICLSAAEDSQIAWEDAQGASLTQYLVKMLNEDPHPTLTRLLNVVSHDIHSYYVTQLHPKALESRENGQNLPFKPEAVNFQDPQLSSHTPLEMDDIFDP